MKNSYIAILVLLIMGLFSDNGIAQQDAQYTQYMYNPLGINPAYAGTREVFSAIGLYRTQWVGLDGAPTTGTFSLHSPVGKRVGLGLNIIHDEIFIQKETYLDIDFSYTIDISDKGKMAFGVKGGAHLLDIDTERANTGPYNVGDSSAEVNIDNKFSPQVGVGAYYYGERFYLGVSVPNLLQTNHFDESSIDDSNNTVSLSNSSVAEERINYYLLTGYVFDINKHLKLKPALLTKLTSGAPLQVDLSANFLIYDKLTLGAAYRWSAAFSAMVGFQISDQLMLGLGYDQETTKLARYNDGSYEIVLRYELFKRNAKMKNPRFF